MSMKVNKNGKEYPLGFMPEHYPADRVYLDGDTSKTVQGKFDAISKYVSNIPINNAWGSLYEGVADVTTTKDYTGKHIQVTFVPDQGQTVIPTIANVLSNKIQVSLLRATTATVSGTINILICNY